MDKEEYKIIKVTIKKVNRKIKEFKEENPNYKVFNISGTSDSNLKVLVIFKLKEV